MKTVAQLIPILVRDPWRDANGFSPEIEKAHSLLFDPARSNDDREKALNEWIERHQPCLFGRLAARANAVTYCILTNQDLMKADEEIRAMLRAGRLRWRQAAYERKSSAFVVLAACPDLANAVPDETVGALAQRLALLLLETNVVPDVRYLDRVGLEIPHTSPQQLHEFKVGVDYFAAHGDKRWWHDHRIPGGIGFSLNSPGHLIMSGQVARAGQLWEAASGLSIEKDAIMRVTTPDKGLELAMRTIWTATRAVSGKATRLLPRTASEAIPKCAADLPPDLANMSCAAYAAYYDTDWTLRSAFFRADVERPAEVAEREMDLTYFYDRSGSNEDADLVDGVRVRQDLQSRTLSRRATMYPRVVRLDDDPTLAGIE